MRRCVCVEQNACAVCDCISVRVFIIMLCVASCASCTALPTIYLMVCACAEVDVGMEEGGGKGVRGKYLPLKYRPWLLHRTLAFISL